MSLLAIVPVSDAVVVLTKESEMERERSLVEHYRRRAEEIRSCAACVVSVEDRATLLQFADEYDQAAIEQEMRMQTNGRLH